MLCHIPHPPLIHRHLSPSMPAASFKRNVTFSRHIFRATLTARGPGHVGSRVGARRTPSSNQRHTCSRTLVTHTSWSRGDSLPDNKASRLPGMEDSSWMRCVQSSLRAVTGDESNKDTSTVRCELLTVHTHTHFHTSTNRRTHTHTHTF